MPQIKRHVIGIKQDKKSGVIYSDNPEYQEAPQIFWRTTLWNTTELPVDNTIGGDRVKDVTQREPSENGLTFRALEIPPDIPDRQRHIEIRGRHGGRRRLGVSEPVSEFDRKPFEHR